ncbi:SEC-C metal-binding domain-containing protein [Paenibacillus chondroitinus]|uniref:SEC-C metal-binding domain-containing protein n=1 Tax=Paenibacillus chondroitinus TaxID=59842 RepID=A0ABU6DJ71_9BACL|nr:MULTISPECIES: SEC-C metal-binding domain-containing protein [Paenibacillus]MCY9657639.1 SEC-C metal-binding domain-containing protein [Paenibacillus anseongense]MEB4797362.1 SEC-C metal-binding domain-containing protein [Paenibacillus chondroitinus]
MDKRKSAKKQNEAYVGEEFGPELTIPLSLADCLVRLTKGDLTEIRTNLEIKGVSTLKKQDLAMALVEHIPNALPSLFFKFDDKRYQIMKQIAGRGGVAPSTLIDVEQISYYVERGLLFLGRHNGKPVIAMPKEVRESFQKLDYKYFREKFQRNAEWIKLTNGLLYYYGHLSFEELHNLVESYMGTEVYWQEYSAVIEDSLVFYMQISPDSRGYHNILLNNPKQVQQEQESRLSVSLYPFTKEQLLAAGEKDFVDRTPAYKAFVDFIRKNYTISYEEADIIVEDCVDHIRNGATPGFLLQSLQRDLEINDLELTRSFMNHIAALNNTTRQWILKGYSPNELYPAKPLAVLQQPPAMADVIDMKTRTKVGRNDPCPCGSGKKFKKCCAG